MTLFRDLLWTIPPIRMLLGTCATWWTLEKLGHARTIFSQTSIDKEGKEIPWFTYPCIDFLSNLDLTNKDIFEFGAGNSTIWWARRVKHIDAVESDDVWHRDITGRFTASDRATVILEHNPQKYIHKVKEMGKTYDIIVVDGNDRHACIQAAHSHLASDGFIVLDNSDWYPETTQYLRDKGYNQIIFTGFGPINHYQFQTSVFLTPHTRLIYTKKASHVPVPGGIIPLTRK